MSFVLESSSVAPVEMEVFQDLLEHVHGRWKMAAGRDYRTNDVTNHIRGFRRAFFLGLPPGGRLHWHQDAGDCQTEHIVLLTNPQCLNLWRDLGGLERSIHMQAGMRYKVDRTLPHAAVNSGSTDRIHLLLEYP